MEIISAKNPIWANAEQTAIDLTVTFSELPGEHGFTATETDSAAHGRELFERAKAGEFGAVADFVPVIETPEPAGNGGAL